MATLAVGLPSPRPMLRGSNSAAEVLGEGDWLKMVRVDAVANSAEMV
jgi:hypothetical protein